MQKFSASIFMKVKTDNKEYTYIFLLGRLKLGLKLCRMRVLRWVIPLSIGKFQLIDN